MSFYGKTINQLKQGFLHFCFANSRKNTSSPGIKIIENSNKIFEDEIIKPKSTFYDSNTLGLRGDSWVTFAEGDDISIPYSDINPNNKILKPNPGTVNESQDIQIPTINIEHGDPYKENGDTKFLTITSPKIENPSSMTQQQASIIFQHPEKIDKKGHSYGNKEEAIFYTGDDILKISNGNSQDSSIIIKHKQANDDSNLLNEKIKSLQIKVQTPQLPDNSEEVTFTSPQVDKYGHNRTTVEDTKITFKGDNIIKLLSTENNNEIDFQHSKSILSTEKENNFFPTISDSIPLNLKLEGEIPIGEEKYINFSSPVIDEYGHIIGIYQNYIKFNPKGINTNIDNINTSINNINTKLKLEYKLLKEKGILNISYGEKPK